MQPLFCCLSGSRLYGLANAESDYDYRGFYMEPDNVILGTSSIENYDKADADVILYGFRKMAKLAHKGNMNIIEQLFIPEEFIIYEYDKDIRKQLLSLVGSKAIYKAVRGFVYGSLNQIKNGKVKNCRTSKKTLHQIDKYDTKSASHSLRLIFQISEFLEHGHMNTTLPLRGEQRDLCLAVKNQEISKDKVIELLESYDKQLEIKFKKSVIEELVPIERVDEFLIETYKRHLNKPFDCVDFEELIDTLES